MNKLGIDKLVNYCHSDQISENDERDSRAYGSGHRRELLLLVVSHRYWIGIIVKFLNTTLCSLPIPVLSRRFLATHYIALIFVSNYL